jgi:hypothetical protein
MKFFLIFMLAGISASATHLKGGFIRVEKNTGLTYNIIVTVFTNTNSNVLFGGDDDFLDFGDGTKISIPEQSGIEIYPGFTIARFETLHTYSSEGNYVVSYNEPNRNAGIVNIDNSVSTRFYLESGFTADPFMNYASPVLLMWPAFDAVANSVFTCAISASDLYGYRLSYYAAVPKGTSNFRLPETFSINQYNGLITWDTMFEGSSQDGEYLFDVNIVQSSETGTAGYMIVDFQITVHTAANEPVISHNQELDENNRIFIPVDANRRIKIFFEDQASSSLSLEMYSEAAGMAEISTYDSTNNGKATKVGVIDIQHDPADTRFNPYVLSVRGTSLTSGETFTADVSFLLYTQDVDLKDVIVSTGENFPPKPVGQTYILYPNPFSGSLTLSAPTDARARLILKTLTNETVYDQVVYSGEVIKVDETDSCFLIYQIVLGDKVFSGKIMKK